MKKTGDEEFGFKPKEHVTIKSVKIASAPKAKTLPPKSRENSKKSRETKQVRKIDISAPIPIENSKNSKLAPGHYVPETAISTMKLEMQPVKKQKSIASKGRLQKSLT